MHNPVPVLENDSHKLLWDFNIQTDHLISVMKSRDNPNDSVTENSQNTEKSPRDLRKLAVTQTLVRNH